MKHRGRIALALTLALALAASLTGAGLAQTPSPAAQAIPGNVALVRTVHASPGGPTVDVLVNNSQAFCSLPFTGVTRYEAMSPGAATLAIVPSTGTPSGTATPAGRGGGGGVPVASATPSGAAGTTTPMATPGTPGAAGAIVQSNVNLRGGTAYSAVVLGQPANAQILLLTDDLSAPPSGQVKVRIVHASPNAPAVDVAVPSGPTLTSNLSFANASDYTTVAAGTVVLEVRPAGSSNVVVTLPSITLVGDVVYTIYLTGLVNGQPPLQAIVAVESVGGNPVPSYVATSAGPVAAAATGTPSAAVTGTATPSTAATATTTPGTAGTGTPGATGTMTPGAAATTTPGGGTPGATGTMTPGAAGTTTPSGATPGSSSQLRLR